MRKITDYIAALKLDTAGAFKSADRFDKRVKRAGISAAAAGAKGKTGFSAFERKVEAINRDLNKTENNLTGIRRKIRRIDFSRLSKGLKGVSNQLRNMRSDFAIIAGAGSIALFKLGKAGSDLQESITAVQAVFKDSSASILEFGTNSQRTIGISRRAFNESAAALGPILANTGKSGEELNMMLIEITKRAADLGSVRNVPVAEVIANFTSGLVGQTEPLLKYGVNLTQANLKQVALSLGITKSVKSMTEQEKAMLRYRAILDKTGFAQGDFEKNVNSVAIQLQIQKARAEDLAATFGKDLEPVMKAVLRVTGRVLKFFENMSPTMRRIVVVSAVTVTAIAALGFILSFASTAIGGFTLLAGAVPFVLGLLSKAMAVARLAVIAFNFVLAINPIILVITAVLALIFIFRDDLIPIVKSAASKFNEFSDLLIFFPNPIGVLIGAVKFLSNVFEFGLGGAIDILWNKMKGFFEFIKNSKIGEFIGDLAGAVASLFGDDPNVPDLPASFTQSQPLRRGAQANLNRFGTTSGATSTNATTNNNSDVRLEQNIQLTSPNAQQSANQILVVTDQALGAAT